MFGEWPYRLLVIDMIVVMIRIGLILERRRRLLSLRYPRLSATGSGKHTAVEVALASHKDSFMADDDVGVRIPYCGADKSIMKSRRYAAARRSEPDVLRVRVTPGVTL